MICGRCGKEFRQAPLARASWYCDDCMSELFKPKKKIITNADRIRAMSDEDLARFLIWNVPSCVNFCDDARCGCKWNCKHCDDLTVIVDWLRQTAKEV